MSKTWIHEDCGRKTSYHSKVGALPMVYPKVGASTKGRTGEVAAKLYRCGSEGMIGQALNGMIALMFAKFVLNDVPHAAGVLGNPNPRSPTTLRHLKPAYDVQEGVYNWTKVVSATPRSAQHAVMYAPFINLPALGKFSWKYTKIPVGWINGWVSVFYKYVGYSPSEARSRAVADEFPIGDYYELSKESDYWPREVELIPGSGGDIERRESFGYWLEENVAWAHRIRGEMASTGVYYPPILKSDYGGIDGVHRSAVLWSMYGPEFEIWAWVMVE